MYESWFRFRRRPFSAAPRSEDYFPAEAAEHARKSTISCIQRGAGPALLIGETGSGKTTACHQLLCHFRSRTSVGHVACAGIASRRSFFQNILFELGRPYQNLDEGELRLSLVDFLTSPEAPGDGTVLVLDDAHELPLEQLDDVCLLSGLTRENEHCVHLVMTGTVRLEEHLAVPKLASLNQRIASRTYLEPFRLHETESYIRRQFERANTMADEIFIRDALVEVHKCTGGVPRLVNQLCDHALVLAAAGGHSQLDEVGLREAWADLQNWPAPEESHHPMEDVVEFGSLDDEDTADNETADNDTSIGEDLGKTDDDSDVTTDTANFAQESADTIVIDYDSPADGFLSQYAAKPGTAEESTDVQNLFGDSPVTEDSSSSSSDAEESPDDYESLPYPGVGIDNDPFGETFDDEEVVVTRFTSMFNRLTDRQPEVISQYGQDLIATLDQLTNAAGIEIAPQGRQTRFVEMYESETGDATSELEFEPSLDRDKVESAVTDGASLDAAFELDWATPPEPQQTSPDFEEREDATQEASSESESIANVDASDSYAINVDYDAPAGDPEIANAFEARTASIEEQDASANANSSEFPSAEGSDDTSDPSEYITVDASLSSIPAAASPVPATPVTDGEFDEQFDEQSVEPVHSAGEPGAYENATLPASETDGLRNADAMSVRVVKVSPDDTDATVPRRRFKQLFSNLEDG